MIETHWFHPEPRVVCGARTSGGSGELLVFVHGVGSTAAIWDEQLHAFESAYRCFAIELRGNGVGAEPPADTITREGFAEDVLAALHGTGDEPFHFVGCSLGGVVGFELWKRAPRRVRSFTFVGSFAAYPDSAQYVANVVQAVKAAGSMHHFAQARAARVVPPGAPHQRLVDTIDQMSRKWVHSYIASTEATWTGDYRAMLPSITVPALVVAGALDPVAPPALSEEIAAGIPGARLEVVAGAGHVTNADAPAAFNRLLRDFLKGTA